jgi:glucose/arabinose dehydrogenase
LAPIALLIAGVASAGTLSGPILNGGATAELVDVVQLPASNGSPALARIGIVREIPDGTGRLLANDLNGPLHLIRGTNISLYMDLRVLAPRLRTNSLQWGLVSFAVHPDFESNGLIYTAHTESIGTTPPNIVAPISAPVVAHAVVTEWQAADPASDEFSGTSRELMRIAAPHNYHNLGEIGFDPGLGPEDPDYGLLYIAAGDFGSVVRGDYAQLQRLDTVFGCLLRIDPLGEPFQRDSIVYDYGIPSTNPYAEDGDPDTFGEIFAHGLRNPQNFHFDRGGSGDLFIAEIGESNLEEINVARAGANYGWPHREGNRALDVSNNPAESLPLPPDDSSFGFAYPVVQYDHDEGVAIAGNFVVRRQAPSALEGKLLFGDIVSGRIFYSDVAEIQAIDDSDPATTADVYELTLLRNGAVTTLLAEIRAELGNPGIWRTDLRFSTDESGRLFVTTKQDGFIREIVPAGPTHSPAAPEQQSTVTNRPNPFNPTTEILFSLPKSSRVRVSIFDLSGRLVRVLIDEPRDAGPHRCPWDGRNSADEEVVSGVYLYLVESEGAVEKGKMTLVR